MILDLGYNLGAQNANAYQPNTKAQGYGPAAPQPNGNGAKGPYKGYGAVPAALGNGNGAKPNGFGAFPGAAKGNGGYGPSPGQGVKPNGYGASPFTSNGQQAKPNPNGGYGSKPNKPGYGAQPTYGGFGAGMRIAPQMANKGRGGYRPAAYPQAGAGQGGGYPNGAKAPKPGYGATKGPKAGYGGYPNAGGFKGPKPGYGGSPTGYGQRPSGYGGYPNGAAKAPKPGYGVGVANKGASNGQGAKPNGYGPVTDSNEKGPKVQSLSPEALSLPSVTGYTKGIIQPAESQPIIPTALPPTMGMALPVTSWKGPKPQVPVVPQGYPSKPIVQVKSPVIPQNKAYNPGQYIPQEALIPELAPLIPQGKGPKPAVQPASEIPQGNPQKPVAPALLPFAEQGKAPKPIIQVPQPVTLHPGVSQGQKPTASVLLPMFRQTKGPKPVAPLPEIPQMKDTKPATPQTAGPPLALVPTPAVPQMKGPKVANPGYGPEPWYPNNGGAKASKPGLGYGPKTKQPGYVNPGPGYGYGNGAAAGLGEVMKGKPGGTGPLPYNGAPIVPARLDGTSPIEPQTAELGPEVKSGHAYGGPYGAQPAGFGSEGKPQVRYGIGGLLFGGSSMGYGPYGKYGNPYATQPYGAKAAGNYNPPEFNANPKSAAKYMMGGSPYSAGASDPKASGKYGPYSGQQLGLPAVAGNSGKYGQSFGPYAPESISVGADAKSSGKYASQYEAPGIDGVKSVDQFGDGEVQPELIAPLVDGVGEGPASYVKGGVRAEAVSLPAASTDGPFTGSATSLGNPGYSPVETPTEAETPQHIPLQQNLKGPQLSQAWTGGEEQKHNLKGFFGNRYNGKIRLSFRA
ncbi:calymmin [Hemibagrus wyckioides]|uniref:calymmin n=1 Tax=Hemibagrus wyckioides TaxID=337641 RepID=UPI00266DBBA3|nr:calymmin [Hemibagrus wyckioides]